MKKLLKCLQKTEARQFQNWWDNLEKLFIPLVLFISPQFYFQQEVNEDLEFLRDQIITAEVNIARIFNFDVRRRRLEKDQATLEKLEADSS